MATFEFRDLDSWQGRGSGISSALSISGHREKSMFKLRAEISISSTATRARIRTACSSPLGIVGVR